MDEIIQALTQLRQNPNNNKYSDEDLISMYGLNRPSFTQGNTGIFYSPSSKGLEAIFNRLSEKPS